ncbi:hypothetical protein [Aliikangiella sp. G2MR2-5]|uniref:hypothetical protein n=1 Tax=Aliikangiella sp. G2MR2-5 TaxID=2788943 RepID=UPI0018AC4826|nr:hypothetical protein [Aliikangiella sp. G2MR2-5]
MKGNDKMRVFVLLGGALILLSLLWLGYAYWTGSKVSLAIFTNIVVGTILILIGKIKPQNNARPRD